MKIVSVATTTWLDFGCINLRYKRGKWDMQSEYRVLTRGLGSLLDAAARQIRDGLADTVSGSMRTQHFGLYYAVVVLTERNEPATVKSVSEFVKLTQPNVNTALRRLWELGVLERRAEPTTTGGKTKYLYSPRTDFEAMRGLLPRP